MDDQIKMVETYRKSGTLILSRRQILYHRFWNNFSLKLNQDNHEPTICYGWIKLDKNLCVELQEAVIIIKYIISHGFGWLWLMVGIV